MTNKDLIHVATFGQPQGLKGEIKIIIFTSSFESFKILNKFFIENENLPFNFKSLKKNGKKIIAKLDNCIDRNEALKLKGKNIFVLRENLPKVNNNEYYIIDLLKCKVVNLNNIYLGDVIDIKNFGAGDLIEVKNAKEKSYYIPMNNENLLKVDLNKEIIVVNPISGILN